MRYVSSKTGATGAFGAFALAAAAACSSSGAPLPGEGRTVGASGPNGLGNAGTGGAAAVPTPGLPGGGAGELPGGLGAPITGPVMGSGSVTEPSGAAGGAATPTQVDGGKPPDDGAGTFRTGPSPGCSNGTSRAVSGHGTLTVSGSARSYELHVPSSGAEPRPLVLALHGYTMSGPEHERITRLSELADREDFVVVYPNGLGSPTSWNAGSCCSYDDKTRDDMGFLSGLVDDLGERLCLYQGRVYATGFSNGGMMAYRMACEMADRIAAAASVSGSMVLPTDECHPVRPVPFMHTHGTADPIVPYDGGSGPTWLTPAGETPQVFPSVEAEVALFAGLNGCTSSTETVFSQRDTTCTRQSACAESAEVMLCTVEGGGHAWPGGADMGLLSLVGGPQSATLPTSDVMWDFLKTHHLP
jgi:polyhydroxybutyrate depolymerase